MKWLSICILIIGAIFIYFERYEWKAYTSELKIIWIRYNKISGEFDKVCNLLPQGKLSGTKVVELYSDCHKILQAQ